MNGLSIPLLIASCPSEHLRSSQGGVMATKSIIIMPIEPCLQIPFIGCASCNNEHLYASGSGPCENPGYCPS